MSGWMDLLHQAPRASCPLRPVPPSPGPPLLSPSLPLSTSISPFMVFWMGFFPLGLQRNLDQLESLSEAPDQNPPGRRPLPVDLRHQSVEIHKRVGAFAEASGTINKCLSDAICAMSRGRLDGDGQAAGLIHCGNDVLETFEYSSEARLQTSWRTT